MRFQRVIEQVFFRPWFITPESHAAIARLVTAKLTRADADDDPMGLGAFIVQRPKMEIDPAGIAHIYIFGALGQGLSLIEKSCGNTDYDDLAKEIAAASNARGVFFHVDSGGGMCSGCLEAAQAIAALDVPTVAHTSTVMASAAYALAVGCDTVLSTASAVVGSIGTICPWTDSSVAWEIAGLKFAPIVSEGADLKSAMHGPSLTAAQVAHLQETADDYAAQFIGHVQQFRAPNEEVYRGGAYVGQRALAYNLTDSIASEAEAYEMLLGRV